MTSSRALFVHLLVARRERSPESAQQVVHHMRQQPSSSSNRKAARPNCLPMPSLAPPAVPPKSSQQLSSDPPAVPPGRLPQLSADPLAAPPRHFQPTSSDQLAAPPRHSLHPSSAQLVGRPKHWLSLASSRRRAGRPSPKLHHLGLQHRHEHRRALLLRQPDLLGPLASGGASEMPLLQSLASSLLACRAFRQSRTARMADGGRTMAHPSDGKQVKRCRHRHCTLAPSLPQPNQAGWAVSPPRGAEPLRRMAFAAAEHRRLRRNRAPQPAAELRLRADNLDCCSRLPGHHSRSHASAAQVLGR